MDRITQLAVFHACKIICLKRRLLTEVSYQPECMSVQGWQAHYKTGLLLDNIPSNCSLQLVSGWGGEPSGLHKVRAQKLIRRPLAARELPGRMLPLLKCLMLHINLKAKIIDIIRRNIIFFCTRYYSVNNHTSKFSLFFW